MSQLKAKISKPLAVGDEQKTVQDFLHLQIFAMHIPLFSSILMCFYLHLLTLFVIHIRTEKDKGISPCDVFAGRVKQKAKKIS